MRKLPPLQRLANKKASHKRWYAAHGKDYKKQNRVKVREWARKQDWKGVLNGQGQQFTSADYDAAYIRQNGRCANMTCKNTDKLHMDHDHSTMRFRGLLCGPCNRALGMCEDTARVLVGLAVYISSRETSYEKTTDQQKTSR
jgi:hypothetical protein